MSAIRGLKKILEATIDTVMLIPDVAADAVLQEWHDKDVESRSKKRLKKIARRSTEGVKEVYQNNEDNDLKTLKNRFLDK